MRHFANRLDRQAGPVNFSLTANNYLLIIPAPSVASKITLTFGTACSCARANKLFQTRDRCVDLLFRELTACSFLCCFLLPSLFFQPVESIERTLDG